MSVIEEAYAAAPRDIEEARQAVFRTREEVSPLYYARMWHIASGKYVACRQASLGSYLAIREHNLQHVVKEIESGKQPQLCLNDKYPGNATEAVARVRGALDRRFQNKSSFED